MLRRDKSTLLLSVTFILCILLLASSGIYFIVKSGLFGEGLCNMDYHFQYEFQDSNEHTFMSFNKSYIPIIPNNNFINSSNLIVNCSMNNVIFWDIIFELNVDNNTGMINTSLISPLSYYSIRSKSKEYDVVIKMFITNGSSNQLINSWQNGFINFTCKFGKDTVSINGKTEYSIGDYLFYNEGVIQIYLFSKFEHASSSMRFTIIPMSIC